MKITNLNICHKVTHEYPKVIEGGQCLIAMDILYTDKADKYGVVYDDGAALYEKCLYLSVLMGGLQMMMKRKIWVRRIGKWSSGFFVICVKNSFFSRRGIQIE